MRIRFLLVIVIVILLMLLLSGPAWPGTPPAPAMGGTFQRFATPLCP